MRNKPTITKKKGCSNLIVGVIFAIILLALIKSINDSPTTTNQVDSKTVNVASTQTVSPPVSTQTPSTPQEFVYEAAEKVYGDDLISVEFVDVDKNAPMLEVYCVFKDNFTNKFRRDIFMKDASEFLHMISILQSDKKIDVESVFIHGQTDFIDKYGNESKGDAMQMRIYTKELQKINWENISEINLEDLAVTFAVHPLFRD